MLYKQRPEFQIYPRFYDDFNEIVGLVIRKTDTEDKTTMFAKEIVWEEIKEGQFIPYNTLSPIILHREDAQVLVDRLWSLGFRPTEASGSAGSMSAVQNHLKMASEDKVWLMKMIEKLLNSPISPIVGENNMKIGEK